ncbi:hypothetical protein NPIL_481891, partial [Nephila pilipes]
MKRCSIHSQFGAGWNIRGFSVIDREPDGWDGDHFEWSCQVASLSIVGELRQQRGVWPAAKRSSANKMAAVRRSGTCSHGSDAGSLCQRNKRTAWYRSLTKPFTYQANLKPGSSFLCNVCYCPGAKKSQSLLSKLVFSCSRTLPNLFFFAFATK